VTLVVFKTHVKYNTTVGLGLKQHPVIPVIVILLGKIILTLGEGTSIEAIKQLLHEKFNLLKLLK
jgi:hypothetical protein